MYKWEFPSANNTGTYGLRSYQESFKDNPMLSLAKEICQNSLDAVYNTNEPVIVEFNRFEVSSNEFPGKYDFLDILFSCEYFSKKNYKNNEAKDFYRDAIGVLENDTFYCLRISDFNTKGLSGSDNDDNSDWTNLVKAVGVSDKGDGQGGSFGHGKFATFACSYFQTVFYSTNCIDGKKVSQGVARLSSFYNENFEKTLGLGYYGNSKCSKMNQEFNIDGSFCRDEEEYGTDIFIMGFTEDIPNWKERIVASVIDTFYVAILNDKLIFKMDNYYISKNTIADMIVNDKIKPFLKENTFYNFASYYDDNKLIFKGKILNENDVTLYLKINNDIDCLNTVAMVRNNGMKIFDKTRMPKNPFYGATLYIENKKTDAFFRSLENPQHDGWSESRHKNEEYAREVTRSLYKFIKDSIISYVEKNKPESIDIGGLNEFLPDDIIENSESDSKIENLAEEKDKKVELKPVQRKNKKNIINIKNEEKETEEIMVEILNQDGEAEADFTIHNGESGGKENNYLNPNNDKKNVDFKLIHGTKSKLYYGGGQYYLSFKSNVKTDLLRVVFTLSGETLESNDFSLINVRINGKIFKKNINAFKNELYLENIASETEMNISFNIDSDEIWPLEVKYYVVEL